MALLQFIKLYLNRKNKRRNATIPIDTLNELSGYMLMAQGTHISRFIIKYESRKTSKAVRINFRVDNHYLSSNAFINTALKRSKSSICGKCPKSDSSNSSALGIIAAAALPNLS